MYTIHRFHRPEEQGALGSLPNGGEKLLRAAAIAVGYDSHALTPSSEVQYISEHTQTVGHSSSRKYTLKTNKYIYIFCIYIIYAEGTDKNTELSL